MYREQLRMAKRIVVKVGTSTLLYPTGKLNLSRMEHIVREIVDLMNAGKEMVLVTSGAVGVGLDRLGKTERPSDLSERQALAAIGQGILLHTYEKFFAEYGRIPAQLLLTRENSVKYHQYINSRNALLKLIAMGALPIINENDAVALEELKIGDNDTLSAVIATLVDADALIILSDIEGVYTANPTTDPAAQLISEIPEITKEVEILAGGAGTTMGTGGMYTKIQAAKIARSAGITMVIAHGSRMNVLRDTLSGKEIGTLFPAKESHLRVRKQWFAFGKRLEGDLRVDEGCEKALLAHGSSLLATGVSSFEGEFTKGSMVRVLTDKDQEIARGIVNYSSDELLKIMGHRSDEIPTLLPGVPVGEVIHRDNLVLMA